MKKATLIDYPILRLTIPLATGIFFMREFHFAISMEVMVLALIGVSVLLGLSLCSRSFTHRWWFGFLLFGFFFGVGMYRMKSQWEAVNVNWPEDKDIYAGVVTEPSVEKNKSVCCKVIKPLPEYSSISFIQVSSITKSLVGVSRTKYLTFAR